MTAILASFGRRMASAGVARGCVRAGEWSRSICRKGLLICCLILAAGTKAQGFSVVELHDSDGRLKAAVSPGNGGELTSLQVQRDGRWIELLYRARNYAPTNGWVGRAPLLWPATGRTLSRDPSGALGPFWTFAGSRYQMPLHGFARDRAWIVKHRARNQVAVALEDDPQSLRLYPFGFRIECRYRLLPAGLEMRYTVKASADNSEPMPFSIGNHITFVMPLVPGSSPDAVTVETPATINLPLDKGGLPTGASIPDGSFATGRRLSGLPARSAISLGGYATDPWLRLRDAGGLMVKISHRASTAPSGTPASFTLWGDAAAGFFSPEPWVGRQNSLVTGEGLVKLKPGKTFHWTVLISVSDTEATSSPSSNAGAHNDQ